MTILGLDDQGLYISKCKKFEILNFNLQNVIFLFTFNNNRPIYKGDSGPFWQIMMTQQKTLWNPRDLDNNTIPQTLCDRPQVIVNGVLW